MHRKIVPDLISEGAAPPVVAATASTRQAAALMCDMKASALVVANEDGSIVGLVSERDLVCRVLAADDEANTVADVMTTDIDVLAADDSAQDAFALMQARGYRHVAVATADGAPLAVLSLADLMAPLQDLIDSDAQAKQTEIFGD